MSRRARTRRDKRQPIPPPQGVPVRVRPRAPWLHSYGFDSYVRIV